MQSPVTQKITEAHWGHASHYAAYPSQRRWAPHLAYTYRSAHLPPVPQDVVALVQLLPRRQVALGRPDRQDVLRGAGGEDGVRVALRVVAAPLARRRRPRAKGKEATPTVGHTDGAYSTNM